jgi:type VI secretion system protein ImpH
MAGEDWGSFSDLKRDLLINGRAYSFFQVVRLLRLLSGSSQVYPKVFSSAAEHIRIRSNLSLAFPSSDVDSIEEVQRDGKFSHFLLTANFLGLYGVSSPLPTFYTEDLMDEAADDESVTREFIDVINQRLFLLLFDSWKKYRQFVQVVEEKNEDHLVRLFSLLGLGEKVLREDVPDAYSLIRYLGLLTQFPRSSVGLRCLLRDALDAIPVEVIPCVRRTVRIPEDQKMFLGEAGNALGYDIYLGEEIDDRMGKFRLRLGPVSGKQFQAILPGGESCERLASLTKFYVTECLEYDVEITLAAGEEQCVCLGQPEWSRLGLSSWVFSGERLGEAKMAFSL